LPSIIHTERLDLIPMTMEFLQASLDNDRAEAERILGVAIPEDWPEAHYILVMRIEQLSAAPWLQPWLLRAMVLRHSQTMIGYTGFHTAPGADYLEPFSPGSVEFGFAVFPRYQRQGYARESALGLMRWAYKNHGVDSFVLTVRPENVPSQALAAQLGFTRIGSHDDEVDGLEDILVYKMTAKDVVG
jgi:ribosomal-protein-alanine N-acetyltransferase